MKLVQSLFYAAAFVAMAEAIKPLKPWTCTELTGKVIACINDDTGKYAKYGAPQSAQRIQQCRNKNKKWRTRCEDFYLTQVTAWCDGNVATSCAASAQAFANALTGQLLPTRRTEEEEAELSSRRRLTDQSCNYNPNGALTQALYAPQPNLYQMVLTSRGFMLVPQLSAMNIAYAAQPASGEAYLCTAKAKEIPPPPAVPAPPPVPAPVGPSSLDEDVVPPCAETCKYCCLLPKDYAQTKGPGQCVNGFVAQSYVIPTGGKPGGSVCQRCTDGAGGKVFAVKNSPAVTGTEGNTYSCPNPQSNTCRCVPRSGDRTHLGYTPTDPKYAQCQAGDAVNYCAVGYLSSNIWSNTNCVDCTKSKGPTSTCVPAGDAGFGCT